MVDIVETIKSFEDYIGGTGCSEKQISEAEKQLNLVFAEDYKLYLRKMGLAYFDGHELTGIGKIVRLNVVRVTKEQKNLNNKVYDGLYAIEEVGIDGLILWQSQDGTIYQSILGEEPIKVFNNLSEYLETL